MSFSNIFIDINQFVYNNSNYGFDMSPLSYEWHFQEYVVLVTVVDYHIIDP